MVQSLWMSWGTLRPIERPLHHITVLIATQVLGYLQLAFSGSEYFCALGLIPCLFLLMPYVSNGLGEGPFMAVSIYTAKVFLLAPPYQREVGIEGRSVLQFHPGVSRRTASALPPPPSRQ
eukprot:Sspe_Gene.93852::Locus_66352_Transcript_1_1_Confidence_1.000_Length_899::g.93852::m.93852